MRPRQTILRSEYAPSSIKKLSSMSAKHKEKILDFFQRHKRMPSYTEIMDLVGFKSKNAVYKLVNRLVEEGVVDKDATGRIIPKRMFGEVPMLGLVEAGIPSTVDADMLDTISIDNYLIDQQEKTFLLEVKGDSMINAHIEEGDYIIAERKEIANNWDIVVAEVDGEWTLKYYRSDPILNTVWLEAANENYADIHPTQSLKIAAVVRGVIRKYS